MSSLIIPLTVALHGLTMNEAVDTALANHPDLRAASARTDAAEARSRQARAPLLPRLGASSRWEVTTGRRPGAVRNTSTDYFGSVHADILVYDFGRSWNEWRAAQAAADAVRDGAELRERDVVAGVRLAFIDALEAKALLAVARETYENQERHRAQIAEWVQVGLRPKIDLARIESDVAQARAEVVRAENAYRTAKAILNQAMGVSGPIDFDVVEPAWPQLLVENESIDRLFALALEERPDLSAVRHSIRSAELSASAASKRLLPAITAGGGASFGGQAFDPPGWTAFGGIALSWTLFDGLGSYAATDAAEAELRIEQANAIALEQQVRTEVEQAKIAVDSAKARQEAAELALQSARELLRLAEERYAQGVGSALELADAQLELTSASSERVRVAYDLAVARALLLRALGRIEWV